LNAPMETNPGLPDSYFDFAFSIYSLGWTIDLLATMRLVYSYLKPGGFYLFSWEHPFYSCLAYQSGAYIVKERYREHAFVENNWNGVPIVMHQRKLSTFINTALATGFQIERLVESEVNLALAQESDYAPERWYSVPRATLVPPTFILKIRKPQG
jgi:SAM-dependent methyltransferase